MDKSPSQKISELEKVVAQQKEELMKLQEQFAAKDSMKCQCGEDGKCQCGSASESGKECCCCC